MFRLADARQQAAWDRTLSLMAFVGGMLGDDPPRPVDLIPERYRPGRARPEPVPAAVSEAVAEAESQAAWAVMHKFFRG